MPAGQCVSFWISRTKLCTIIYIVLLSYLSVYPECANLFPCHGYLLTSSNVKCFTDTIIMYIITYIRLLSHSYRVTGHSMKTVWDEASMNMNLLSFTGVQNLCTSSLLIMTTFL